ncbi:MAG: ribose 5-phosphate isomerase B [Planctomycetes bacterium]|nr:ribose 5-phosphate isomerase B [Planctomycetota bacterium]
MRVAIGADHAGFEDKRRLAEVLSSWGHDVEDVGTFSSESCDYPDFAERVARAVVDQRAERGVLVCGTGIGMSIVANKFKGVRAAVVTDAFTAEVSRGHNDANILCMGARVTPLSDMERLLRIFLETAFEGGRHARRVEKINKLE